MTHNPDTMTHDCCATWHLIGVKIPFESFEQAKRYRDSRPATSDPAIYVRGYNWSNAR